MMHDDRRLTGNEQERDAMSSEEQDNLWRGMPGKWAGFWLRWALVMVLLVVIGMISVSVWVVHKELVGCEKVREEDQVMGC
jgi:hypothetical protein